jgi:integrase
MATRRPKLRRGFYWREDVIWVRRDPIEQKRLSTRLSDPEAAYAWRAERERQATDKEYAASRRATVGSWVERMLELKGRSRSEGTLNMYETKLGHLSRIAGVERDKTGAVTRDVALAAVDANFIDAYILQRSTEGAGNNTIARELTCIGQLLKHAWRAGEFLTDPRKVMPIGFSAGYKPVTRTLKRSDLPKLLAACTMDQQRAYICLSLAIGGDRVDVENARPEDYDRERQVIHVHGTKNEARDAEIPVVSTTRELLEYALPFMPISWPSASSNLGKVCRRAGIPHLSPKDLRRTASSWMVADGVDQSNVSRWMRHKDDQMVRKIYGQLTPDELGRLIAESGTRASHVALFAGLDCSMGQSEFELVSCDSSEVSGDGIEPPTRGFSSLLTTRARRRYGCSGRRSGVQDSADPPLPARRYIRPSTPASQESGYWAGRKGRAA